VSDTAPTRRSPSSVDRDGLFEEVQRRNEQLSVLNAIAASLSQSLNLNEVLYDTLLKVTSVMRASIGTIQLLDEDTGNVRLAAQSGLPDEAAIALSTVGPGDGLSPQVISTGEPLIISEYSADLRRLTSAPIRSLICVPIKAQAKTVGTLVAGYYAAHTIQSHEVDLLVSIGNQIGVAVQNVRLFERNRRMYLGSIKALTAVVDAKDAYTYSHSEQVVFYARAIAAEMGLDTEEIELVAKVHDIGKVGIDERILNKRGKLETTERALVMSHSEIGALILSNIDEFKRFVPAVCSHHERIDGKGYPDGLKGDEIPLYARLLAVADDRMYEARRVLQKTGGIKYERT
jgi:putative nucleotidyltransferase with HDIG domain